MREQEKLKNIIVITGDRSRFPRMMVSDDPITTHNKGNEAIVIAKFGISYAAVDCDDEDVFLSGSNDYDVTWWRYAAPIPGRKTRPMTGREVWELGVVRRDGREYRLGAYDSEDDMVCIIQGVEGRYSSWRSAASLIENGYTKPDRSPLTVEVVE